MTTDRLLHLLTEQTDRTLTKAESDELDRLLVQHPDWSADDFELAAAASQLAFLGEADRLPEALARKLMSQVSLDVSATMAMPSFDPPPPSQARIATQADGAQRAKRAEAGGPASPDRNPRVVPIKKQSPAVWAGWIAAAAMLLIAILSWWLRPQAANPLDPAQLHAELTAKPGVIRARWTELGGEVLWDRETQRGVMRFEGLAKNDPSVSQYQLWIFDAQREEAHPVDGGVFDSDAGVLTVPIDAKIRVFEPTAFAVTVERPGGVVVSKRERVVALAKVES